jgi:uncharacterized membrane protein YfcA
MLDSFWIYPILFIAGFSAGLVDSIAGGGGLITLPVLLGVGFPPHIALGTNKFQSSFGSFTASVHYIRNGAADLSDCKIGILYTLIGSALGAWSVQRINADALGYIIPFLLVGIVIYTVLSPKVGELDKHAKLSRSAFYLIFGLLLGFYDGFFGPGTGSFWAIAFVALLGFNLTKATGYTKVMNFTSNIVSLIMFAIGGYIVLWAGIIMAVGEILGARIGSGLAIKNGAKFIKPIFVIIVILTAIKILYNQF